MFHVLNPDAPMPSADIPFMLAVLDQLATQSDQVFFLYNLKTRHLDYINPIFRKVWEVKKEASNVETLFKVVHPDDRGFVEESYRGFLRGDRSKRIEFRLLLSDGSVKWLSLLAYYLLEDLSKNYIVGFIEEITGRKEREDTAAKYNARKNAVLEILSHDLKGSIAMINTLNGEVREYAKAQGNEQVSERTRVISQICTSNLEMIHSLLDTEFLESAAVELIRKRLDLVENVQAVFNEYKHSERLLDRDFRLSSASESVYVEVDEVLFTQVFNNLLSNAVKFTRDGGSITVSLEEDKERVLVSVRDDGVGIPKELQPALFERFTKARREGLKGEESTGLGMSIVKRIIELHGGRIWVESGEKEGTSVFFDIPKMTRVKAV